MIKFSRYYASKNLTLLEALNNLYLATLDAKNFQPLDLPKELKDLSYNLYQAFNYNPKEFLTFNKILKKNTLPLDKDLTIYLFTGGKDSLASYLKYRHKTRKRQLIYFKGLNPLYTKEDVTFHEIEKVIEEKVRVIPFKSPRVKGQVESSLKNLLSYVMAIENCKAIPKRISFGYIKGEEELEEVIDPLHKTAKAIEFFEEEREGSPQTSEVYGDSLGSAIQNILLLESYYKGIDFTEGMESLYHTFKIVRKHKLQHHLSSCMSLPQHKQHNKDMVNKKYGYKVGGEYIIGGTIMIGKKKSTPLHRLQRKLSKGEKISMWSEGKKCTLKNSEHLKLHHLKNYDKLGSYECGVCFKCVERYIMNHLYFKVEYSNRFINSRYRLLVKNLLRFKNNNEVNMETYFIEVDLNKKRLDTLLYHNYITQKEYVKTLSLMLI